MEDVAINSAPAVRRRAGSGTTTFFLPAVTLWQRELVRFFRQPSRVIGALGTPLLFWVLIGSGLGTSFRESGGDSAQGGHYLEYFFPGMLLLIVMFTSIFASFSLIQDRQEGFLQAVLVSPASRGSIVLGKIAGGATIALLQALLVTCLAPLIGIPIHLATGFVVAGVVLLIALALTALGFALAWPMDSIQGFHGIMNLLLMPMWLLSGALFPASGASGWLRVIMEANPLTYGQNLLRWALAPESVPAGTNITLSFIITIAFAVVTYALSWIMICRRQTTAR
jgi:ABC-2 type transport system permease protein